MAKVGRFETVEPTGRFETVPDTGRFELVDESPGVVSRVLESVRAAFSPRFTGTPEETARHLREQPIGQALLDILSAAGTAVFPFATAAGVGTTAALEGPVPEPLTDIPPVGLAEATGFESLPGGLPGAATLAGALAAGLTGGGRSLVGALRRPVAAVTAPIKAPIAAPAAPVRKALPAFGESTARRTFETGPSTLGKPSEFFRQLPKDVAEDKRVLIESVGRHVKPQVSQSLDDLTTKAVVVRAQRAHQAAQAAPEPTAVPPFPDEATTAGSGPTRPAPPEVAIAANLDAQVPPSVGTITWADRALNALRSARGRLSPSFARQLGQDFDIAKAHPSADAVIQAKYRAHALMVRRGQVRQEEFWRIWEGVPDETVEQVGDIWKLHRFQPKSVWIERAARQFPQFNERISRTADWFKSHGDYFVRTGRLTQKQLDDNPNYFPWLRERIRVDQKQLNLIENRGVEYFSVWRGSGLTKPYQEFFQRQVKGRTAPKNLKLRDVIRVYSNAISRAETLDEIFMPTVRAQLGAVPSDMQAFVMHNINNFLGVEGAASKELAQWAGVVKSVQAQRTLTGLSAPAHNLTQQTLTMAKFGYTHASAAYKDVANRELWNLARDLGVISKYSTKDFEEAVRASSVLGRAWERIGNIGLSPFRGSEQLNRVHALATGMRAARAAGVPEGKLLNQAGFRAVLETQGPLVKTGVLGQFKTFPLFMLDVYKDMSFGMAASGELLLKGLATGNRALIRESMTRGAPGARWLTLTVGLFGGDALWVGLDEKVTKRFLGEAMKFEGILPYMGISLAHVVGTGAIPTESYQSFLFFLPGPAAANVAELVSVLTGLRLNPFHDRDRTQWGKSFNTPNDIDEMRGRLVRAIPMIGAIQVNRLIEARRRAIAGTTPETAAFAAPGDVVASTDWYEAFGLAPATGELIDARSGVEPASVLERLVDNVPLVRGGLEAAGLRPEASTLISEQMRRIAERNRDIASARDSAAILMATGDETKIDLAVRKLETLRDKHGEEAFGEVWDGIAKAVSSKVLARATTRLSRRIITGARVGVGAREELGQRRGIIQALVDGLMGQ